MSEIGKILRHEMDANGPISFARFMAIALYCPKFGYYERRPAVIGSRGDFYTSVSISPVFGQLLAWQFAEWSGQLGPGPITWIEAGAHDGRLALTMLDWLGKNRPALLERLTYWIIEPSPTRCQWQQQALRPFGSKVQWAESCENDVTEVPTQINGIIFSNELIDAFPIHRVAWDAKAKQWFECGVSRASSITNYQSPITNYQSSSPSPPRSEEPAGGRGSDSILNSQSSIPNPQSPPSPSAPPDPQITNYELPITNYQSSPPTDETIGHKKSFPVSVHPEESLPSQTEFVWVRLPCPNIDIERELTAAGFEIPSSLREVLPDGYIIDLAPSARTWWSSAARRLAHGKLLTIDYGGTANELLKPERPGGTLRAYFQHHATSDVLARAGEQDLTAHVNFTQLQRAGENAGLKTETLTSQETFLSGIFRAIVQHPDASAHWTQQQLRDIQRLIHPEHLGKSFPVLVQSK
jgi:SAM-dependent MidA family methyltransferase